jgi:hypothetical protein
VKFSWVPPDRSILSISMDHADDSWRPMTPDLSGAPARATSINPAVRERLAAKRRRARTLRTTIASGTVAVFVGLWLLLYVQLASGNDPALSANAAAADATTTRTTAQAAATAPTTSVGTPAAQPSSTDTQQPTPSVSATPMTTRQS